jgi:DNA-nicking Smr family endonuclease
MSSGNPPESRDEDDDTELFRRAMRDVRPLERAGLVGKRRAAPPRARFARAERASVLAESLLPPGDLMEVQAGDELTYRREGVSDGVMRRLRRGTYRIEAELDLHGHTAAQAGGVLAAFLREARTHSVRCVRIIHGKGLRSGQRGPVLKNVVNGLLRRSDAVLAFTSARPAGGGTGATLVLLRAAT